MMRRPSLPAIRHTSMLGINLAGTCQPTFWVRMWPASTTATPEEPCDLATKSSTPTVSHQEPRPSYLGILDKCLQKYGAMEPFRALFDPSILGTDADELETTDTTSSTQSLPIPCSPGSEGLSFQDIYTISVENCSSLSSSLTSSRRSSWATSISTSHDGENDQKSAYVHTKFDLDSESVRIEDDLDLLKEFQHYHELIDKGTPQNYHSSYIGAKRTRRVGNEDVLTPETAESISANLAHVAERDVVSDSRKASVIKAVCHIEAKHTQPNNAPAFNSHGATTPSSTPAEAAAWAHSYCHADPEFAKLKLLTDDGGREYVLYRDCFHCVPIELAPEIVRAVEADKYGCGTCDDGIGGTTLGTIPEEEHEG
ncbi:hypothetical protein N8I77_006844 [Diaporthe amygdali]|uniref:Uncharacterized protein n=1 Tax=Phomopsis amygdali TaxID=1214568 RepID=A0AAD9SIT7_PHOAM|nr:hypothetical protein N8I77_006844 [Diaporthe amygdali]